MICCDVEQLSHEVKKAINACYLINPTINDLLELETYFKFKLIVLDENYVEFEKVLNVNIESNYEKYIYF